MENKKPENPKVYPIINQGYVFETGITLRDYFANSAMQGHIASYYGVGVHNTVEDKEALAEQFYLMADAMLKQREL